MDTVLTNLVDEIFVHLVGKWRVRGFITRYI